MRSPELQAFIDDVELVLADTDDQYEITERLAPRLSALLTDGYRLPPEYVRPSPTRHQNYPLYIAPDDRLMALPIRFSSAPGPIAAFRNAAMLSTESSKPQARWSPVPPPR